MFVHIIGTGSMFTKDMYAMISTYFEKEKHCFISKFPAHENFQGVEGGGGRVIRSKSIRMLIELYKCDYIIIHGMINKLVLFLFALQPWLLKKCNWVIWGGDIYCHQKKPKSISERFLEKIRCFVAPRVRYITTVVDNDYNLAKEWYGITGTWFKATYPVPISRPNMYEKLEQERTNKSRDCVNIIVGNSATDTNQHLQALDLLSHLKDENIHIFLPLNYGSGDYKSYAEKVIRYAINMFGDKVTPLLERLEGEDYLYFLNDMDVGIFNNNRQQGLGNISQLILCGVKVYIRKDTEMWPHFVQLGCKLNDVMAIKKINLKQLVEESKNTKEINMSIVKRRHSISNKVSQWKYIFETIESSNCVCRSLCVNGNNKRRISG